MRESINKETGYDGQAVFVDLTYDAGFKAVFADEANKKLLIRLLNHVLPDEAHVNDIVKYLDREQQRDTQDGKKTQFDLICEGEDGTRFIVELQRGYEAAFFQRCVYYASGAYHNRLRESELYSELRPVYSIGFLNYTLQHERAELWDTDYIVSRYVFTEKRTGEVAPSSISIIFVELKRFTKNEHECCSEADWLFYVFRHSRSLTDIPKDIRNKPFFKELLEACRIAAFSEEKKLRYERSMMLEKDIIAQRVYAKESGYAEGRAEGFADGHAEGLAEGLAEGREEGREEGRAEGRAEGREVGLAEGHQAGREEGILEMAKKMLKIGMPMEQVSMISGLTEAQLQALE